MSNTEFKPDGLAMLIGSQPLRDHKEAARLVFEHAAQIPSWVQLPVYPQEGMVAQFLSGLPGVVVEEARHFVDTTRSDFDDEMLAFYEAYLAVCEPNQSGDPSRFALTPQVAPGFFTLLDALDTSADDLRAVKGQVTGPITFCTGLHDQEGRAIFYNDALRDAAVKMLALKAAWQARKLARAKVPVIIFVDEPALAGYGSSELISISREDISSCLQEVIDAIHAQQAMAGVHVCANTDWSLLLTSDLDIVNFDAHGYFDKLILYAEQLKRFLASGRFMAWGLVPTLKAEQIEAETVESLWQGWNEKIQQLGEKGMAAATVKDQSFITPACGTGSLTPELSRRVLELTRGLSARIRNA
jgi:methionine synthase II (cobalamin-independent)